MKALDTLFTPADFATLSRRNLDDAMCVVFDVFRATSSMVVALANGAAAVVPVAEISEALAIASRDPGVLLAGERDGLRIGAELTGGRAFDLGNSPREFTHEKVAGRTVAMTTTNGTRALRSCAHARTVLAGSFLNLEATAARVEREKPGEVIVVCSGTFDQAAYEDVLAAGALCERLWKHFEGAEVSDGALMSRELALHAARDRFSAASESRNGRRLLSRPELRDDIPFCFQRDIFNFTAQLNLDGRVVRVG